MLHFFMFKFVYLFHPILPFLKIHLIEVFTYFMLVIFFWCWLVYRKKIFISFVILFISAEGLFHIFPEREHQQSFLSQYNGYPIFVLISGVESHFFAPNILRKDPLWIQGHLSPLWANLGVRDTLGIYYDPTKNYSWPYKNKKFILLNKAAIRPKGYGATVMVSKTALLMKPHWLRTWDNSSLLIANKPTIYTQQVWSTFYPKLLGKKVDFLDQRAAILY